MPTYPILTYPSSIHLSFNTSGASFRCILSSPNTLEATLRPLKADKANRVRLKLIIDSENFQIENPYFKQSLLPKGTARKGLSKEVQHIFEGFNFQTPTDPVGTEKAFKINIYLLQHL
jgi:hypothetical protein